jgi:hypothetical protein
MMRGAQVISAQVIGAQVIVTQVMVVANPNPFAPYVKRMEDLNLNTTRILCGKHLTKIVELFAQFF